MGVTYFKRFRMEVVLRGLLPAVEDPPVAYQFHPWDPSLVELHAEAKYQSFCGEIDAVVFPCLGDLAGCHRLMTEISEKRGFLPEATWLVTHSRPGQGRGDACGTIQGISDGVGGGSIQNLGIIPEHRGAGLGTQLLLRAMAGFAQAGMERVYLEVTAQNADAIRLYRRIGFRRVKTVYKAVEVAYS